MKRFLFFLLIPCSALSQQIELTGGIHYMKPGHKPVYGIAVQHLSGPWGGYASWYHYSVEPAAYSQIIRTAQPGQPVDSTVAITKLMPHGFTVGACYTFGFGLSVSAGAGLSINREGRNVFTEYYTGPNYGTNDHQIATGTVYVTSKKLSLELMADFDLLNRSAWAVGPRAGYNTQNGLVGELFVGYWFGKP